MALFDCVDELDRVLAVVDDLYRYGNSDLPQGLTQKNDISLVIFHEDNMKSCLRIFTIREGP